MKSAILLALVVIVTHGQAAKLPESFPLCKRKDPNLDNCLRNAIEKSIRELKPGLPSLQMLPLDPLDITQITIRDGINRPVNIKLDLNNAVAKGLSGVNIFTVRADIDKGTISADGVLPFATLESDYEMDGRFLVLPIKGKGKSKLTFTGMNATINLESKIETKNGKGYWNVDKLVLVIKEMDNFQINFENLFNGDKALGDNTNKILNENWRDFWKELKPAFEETFGQVFLHLSRLIFSKVPLNDIFLE
ncbi:protein takeout-like [Periplaneta americana]|uniref:protein takeout-like n=1 Tax=Periplaneta americana TaxID=6978 RepID=UPI0037E7A72B